MIIILDTETNGLPKSWKAPATDTDNWPRLVQLAWRTYENNGTLIDQTDYIITPDGWTIPDEVAAIHGITTERALEEGISLTSAIGAFRADLVSAQYVVAHNIDFDAKIIGAEFIRMKLDNWLDSSVLIGAPELLDTMKSSVDFCALPGQRGYKFPKLGELYRALFLEEMVGGHDAVADAAACAKCFWRLLELGVIKIDNQVDPADELDALFPATPVAEFVPQQVDMTAIIDVEIKANNDLRAVQAIAADPELDKQAGEILDFLIDQEEKKGEETADYRFISTAPVWEPERLQWKILDAYGELQLVRKTLYEATEVTRIAKEMLEARKLELTREGKITGKNDTERKSQLDDLALEQVAALRRAEAEERDVRYYFDSATTEVEMVRALLRVAEMASGGRIGER